MKLSIWQQFSSNHSSHFIVIGRFQDVTDAQAKTEELRDWIHKMLWGNDDLDKNKRSAEAEIIAKYGVNWYQDGIRWNGYPDDIDETVRQFYKDVFIICPVETWDSNRPFVELLKNMGAQYIVQHLSDWYSTGIVTDLQCVAPDDDVANDIFTAIKDLLDENVKDYFEQNEVPMPWAKFSPKLQSYAVKLAGTDYDKHEGQWIHDENAWNDFYRANSIDSDGTRLKYEETRHLWSQREQFMQQDGKLSSTIYDLRDEVRIHEGDIKLDANIIDIKNLNFDYVDIGTIALVSWLEAQGCKVNYVFREKEMPQK